MGRQASTPRSTATSAYTSVSPRRPRRSRKRSGGWNERLLRVHRGPLHSPTRRRPYPTSERCLEIIGSAIQASLDEGGRKGAQQCHARNGAEVDHLYAGAPDSVGQAED